MDVFELYNTQSPEAAEIIEKYQLHRSKVRFTEEAVASLKEGLTLLQRQTISDLEELHSDVFGDELLMAESLRFFMFLLTIQVKPNHDWDSYYTAILDYFHTKELLKWKYKYATQKQYKEKRVILTIKDENVNIQYQSTQAVINDFGRYRADIILSKRKKFGSIMSLHQVLELVL